MTTQLQILTIIAAVLVTAERLLSKGVIGPNWTLTQKGLALAIVTTAIAVLNSVVGGDTWATAITAAIATSGTALLTAVIQAISEQVELRRKLRLLAAAVAKTGLLLSVLSLGGCALFRPVASSPCEGLYCVGVETAGVPGTELICYQTEAEAKTKLAARGCTLDSGAARAVCR